MKDFNTNFMATGQNPDEHGYVNQHGLSRKHIFESVKASLERLQLDYVDLLQCHRFDKETPIEETMQALHDVVQAGYVRYIGMSSCYAWQFHAMQNYAIANKLTPFISMQNHYNLVYREEEREMLPTLKHLGVGVIPWSPLARGLLTRPLTDKAATTRGTTDWMISRYLGGAGTEEIVKRVEEIAKKRNISMAQVSVAWMLTKDPSAAPIVGTTSLKNLQDILGMSLSCRDVLAARTSGTDVTWFTLEAVNVTLTSEEMQYLEEPYRAQAIIGHT
ncbi:hypothetical protein NP233_g10231 [Leucocoprinus birnbaumii]|uniref:NADP-dependent oxidoreductase domain-containing protein n=1 Tax=Leucocoprinus birnbaumii TaxID=56174 RepID=A0AAD5VJM3_9AGAR|nr:hypothetical protein NP233_g10231 [Leucocoprinus birnbaumii]